MSIIRTRRYIDCSDLPEAAQVAYRDFVRESGQSSGQPWFWVLGEPEDDSVPVSYVGPDAAAIVDAALRDAGIEDGEGIDIVFEW